MAKLLNIPLSACGPSLKFIPSIITLIILNLLCFFLVNMFSVILKFLEMVFNNTGKCPEERIRLLLRRYKNMGNTVWPKVNCVTSII